MTVVDEFNRPLFVFPCFFVRDVEDVSSLISFCNYVGGSPIGVSSDMEGKVVD